VVRGDS
jgi:hypothetical protein